MLNLKTNSVVTKLSIKTWNSIPAAAIFTKSMMMSHHTKYKSKVTKMISHKLINRALKNHSFLKYKFLKKMEMSKKIVNFKLMTIKAVALIPKIIMEKIWIKLKVKKIWKMTKAKIEHKNWLKCIKIIKILKNVKQWRKCLIFNCSLKVMPWHKFWKIQPLLLITLKLRK